MHTSSVPSEVQFTFGVKCTLIAIVGTIFMHCFPVTIHCQTCFTFILTFCATEWNSMHGFNMTSEGFPIFCYRVTFIAFEYFPRMPVFVISQLTRSVGFEITNSTTKSLHPLDEGLRFDVFSCAYLNTFWT